MPFVVKQNLMLVRKMRILHIVAGLPREGGGLSELVPAFAREAALLGHDVSIATVAGENDVLSDAAAVAVRCGVKLLRFAPAPPRRLFFSAGMLRGLCGAVAAADVVHVHSNWTFPVWWGCHLALSFRKKLVLSPQGCLERERLKRSAWKKRIAGWLFDRRFLRRATVIHATCDAEAYGIRSYLGAAEGALPITVIPNGADSELLLSRPTRDAFDAKWPACQGKQVVLSLSRLNPLKGLDLLVSAWGRVSDPFPAWHLLIAGPDEGGHERRLRQAVQAAGISSRVTFCGPLYGADKAMAMRNASLFVLPTRNENFGIAVAESLACGVPVITTKGAPWAELMGNSESAEALKCESSKVPESVAAKGANQANTDNLRTIELPNSITSSGRCGWWVDIGAEPLARALREAMGLSAEELRAMGESGRRLVERKYTWSAVAARMVAAYSSKGA